MQGNSRVTAAVAAMAALLASFWAYTIADSLLNEFSGDLTFVDLAVLWMLGLIPGALLTVAVMLRRKRG